MHPYFRACISGQLMLYFVKKLLPAGNEQSRFGMKRRNQAKDKAVQE